jgi:hypothetical protein
MPLSAPAPREQIHTRTIVCEGFRREDNLWDIEGRLTDVKTYAFQNHDRGEIVAGEPIHDMAVRLTIDDDMLVHDTEATMDNTPYHMCPNITPNFKRLIGLKIAGGFRREVAARLGGVQGCTHLVDLLGPLATTAFQTIFPIKSRQAAQVGQGRVANRESVPDPGVPGGRPMLLGTCHSFAPDSGVVARLWPAWHKPKQSPDQTTTIADPS